MNRMLALGIGTVLIAGATGVFVANSQQRERPVFISGDRPVVEDQVRAKLRADGWSDVTIAVSGRYFQVIGVNGGQRREITVDSQTGRLRTGDDDDDDD